MEKTNVKTLALGGLIAALYAVLTYVSSLFSLAYGPVQFRVSEMLTVLPIFTPAAIPGLTIGCMIANIGSFNAVDLAFGTAATLISAILTRKLRKISVFKLPLPALLPPVLVNALVVGLEISVFYLDKFSVWGFLISALQVGLGQLTVCYGLGIPFYLALKKHAAKLFS